MTNRVPPDLAGRDLNFHHLRYFWMVAREGSIAKACLRLHVAQPTISGQLRELEQQFGDRLFTRAGRGLQLTETGRLVLQYANEIFALGDELSSAVAGSGGPRTAAVQIGIADALPKAIAYRLLRPALALADPVRLQVIEGPPDRLFASLAVQDLDVVLGDRPHTGLAHVKAFSHLLGDSAVAWFAAGRLRRLAKGFPESLAGQPALLPGGASQLRLLVEDWCAQLALRLHVVVESEDHALLQTLGGDGLGIFPAPVALADELRRRWGAVAIGTLANVRERWYAITIERRITHPAVLAITRAAPRVLPPA